MRRLLPLLLLLALPVYGSTTSLTGTITDAQGNPVNGRLVMQLPVPATDTTTGRAVAPTPVVYQLVNGVILGGSTVPLYDVANLQPQNLYYSARVYDSSGTLVFTGNYAVTGVSYNLGAAVPTNVTTSNISYISPASTNSNNTFTGSNTFTQPIIDTVSTGTAPFTISSTSLVANLNAQFWNGFSMTGPCGTGQVITATGATAFNCQSSASAVFATYLNSGSPGTSPGLLAKLTGAPSTVSTAAISDTGGVVGICVSGCTTSGSASITTVGTANCIFDGATTAGDYVQISSTTAGNCHDAGATYPTANQIIGRVLSTNGGSGTYSVSLFGIEIKGPNLPYAYGASTTSQGTCPTTNSNGATCAMTVPLGRTEVDTAYKVACMGSGTITGYPFVLATSKSTTQVVVTISNGAAAQAVISSIAEMDCVISR